MRPSGCSASAVSSSAGRSVSGTDRPSNVARGAASPVNRSDNALRCGVGVARSRRVQQVALGERLDLHLAPVGERDPTAALGHRDPFGPDPVRLARDDPPARRDERALPAVQAREVRHVAHAQALVGDGQAHPQLVLGELRGGRHELGHGRVDGVDRAGDVDRAEDQAGVGVVHGRRGARPDVVGAHEVLGRVDRHRRVDGQRGAHGVGADRRLGHAEAGGEAGRVGRVQQPGGAFAPEDRAVGVGDQHDVHGLVGDAHEGAAQERHHVVERVAVAQVGHLVVAVHRPGHPPVGVDVRGQAPFPRRADERPRGDARLVARHDGLEHVVQNMGVPHRIVGTRLGHQLSGHHRSRDPAIFACA